MRPARAGNVAAACRAMKNVGLRRLWLVDPPPALLEHEARALAYGAWDVLDGPARARPRRGGGGELAVVGTTEETSRARGPRGASRPRRTPATAS